MRVMAIDYGDARTGVAFSDLTGSITGDAFTIPVTSLKAAAGKLAALAAERDVRTIVLGLPLNMDGSEGERSKKSRILADMLSEATGLDVILWDERRTTVDAHRILSGAGRHGKKRREKIDAVAASLILEGYLNRSG